MYLAPSAKTLDEGVIAGNNKHTQRRCDKHPPENSCSHDILCTRPRTARAHQGHDTEDESKCSHQDGTEAQSRRRKRGILEWIANAKKAETRAKRIEETATRAARNERANQWPR